MNTSATLLQLRQLSTDLRGAGDLLAHGSAELGEDNVEFVVNAAVDLESIMNELTQRAGAENPLESRQLRHDLRNKVAIVKGFSDLMQMDASPSGPWAGILARLMDVSDKFVDLLDTVKDHSGQACGAALFA